MNLAVSQENEIKKKLFTLKSASKDGLILKVHHTDKQNQKIRFIHCSFNYTGQVLACSDNGGNTYIVDFHSCKFWNIPNVTSCTILKFSILNPDDVLIGLNSGKVTIIDIETGSCPGKLIGHKYPVKEISYSHDFYCLTSSKCEAIIWDLNTYCKVQVLALEEDWQIKHVLFMPVTSNILACFANNIIQIWKYATYETHKQILPNTWNDFTVKSIAFTQNGRDMVLAGHSSQLVIFQLNKWKVSEIISLPDYILTVKDVKFIPQSFDGGCNRTLAILSGQGVIYFYDLDQCYIISELVSNWEITKFECGNKGNYIACCLCTGEVEIYDVIQFVVLPVKTSVQAKAVSSDGKIRLRRSCSKLGFIKREICEVLDIVKLKDILKEFGAYPDSYRMKIWEHLLDLPNNKDQYNGVINHISMVSFGDLYKRYPMEDKMHLRALKKLLNNLVTWCPFFSHVDYLPVFCFPFVKVFNNKPISCFEAVCTIMMNWCQYWFEYFPLPPINILAIIENVLLEHDPDLLEYLSKQEITSRQYAWPLLETAFSEVLTAPQWLTLWDHVLTNEPAFLLCATVAYCIIQRGALLTLKSPAQFHTFFHMQYPLDVRKLLAKTYTVLETTSPTMHPRQYLNMFTRMEIDQYPKFLDYPKTIVDYQTCELSLLKKEVKKLEDEEVDMVMKKEREKKFLTKMEMDEVEKIRIFEMEKALKEKLLEEQQRVKQQQDKITELRQKLQQEEKEILEYSKQKMMEYNNNQRKRVLESLMTDLKLGSSIEDFKMRKAEGGLLTHLNELQKHRDKIEMMLTDTVIEKPQEELDLHDLKKKFNEELLQAHQVGHGHEHLKQLNIATGLKAVDKLIHKVEDELIKTSCDAIVNTNTDSVRVDLLQLESKELELEVSKLLKMLGTARSDNNQNGTRAHERSSFTITQPREADGTLQNITDFNKKSDAVVDNNMLYDSKRHGTLEMEE